MVIGLSVFIFFVDIDRFYNFSSPNKIIETFILKNNHPCDLKHWLVYFLPI